ncbi:MAG: T9SS type A sorting domain-containing protein [Bacteroidetes bacterium]|nr:T9SS type A sorting domain-containing protein [Bacteroidota bacterium]
MKQLFTLGFSLLLISNAGAQNPNWVWAHSGGGNAVTTDKSGNVYVSGSFKDSVIIGGTKMRSTGGSDVYVAKYNKSGSTQWVKQLVRGAGDQAVNDIAIDTAGNIILCGSFRNGSTIVSNDTLLNMGGDDMYLAKFNNAGTKIWSRRAGGVNNDFSYGKMAIDQAGNICVNGMIGAPAMFGTIAVSCKGQDDIVTAKYDKNGNVLWAKNAGGKYADRGFDVAVDTAGNIYTTGYYTDTASFDLITFNNNGGAAKVFVAKQDTSGNYQWVKSAGKGNSDIGLGISLDKWGNIYITGNFSDSLTIGNTINSYGIENIFIARYDASGNEIWSRVEGGTNYDNGLAITTNAFGNVFVTGHNNYKIYIASYDTTGNKIWTTYGTSPGNGEGDAICADADGNVYVTGSSISTSSLMFGTTVFSTAASNSFLVKLGGWPTEVPVTYFGFNELTVFPNPSKGIINVGLDNADSYNAIHVINALGQSVYHADINPGQKGIELNLIHLQAGMYLLRANGSRSIATAKFIIE